MPKKSNTPRIDGRLQSKVFIGNVDGQQKYKYLYAKTQKELDEKVLEVKLSLKKGIDPLAERDTFKEWADRWLRIKKMEVSNGWYVALCSLVDCLEPIYYLPISKIRTADIQDIVLDLSIEPRDKTGKPYSKKTLKELKNTVSSIFQLAIDNRVLDYNPVTPIKMPKAAEKQERRALTEDEQQWIIDTPHRAQRAAMIMMFAGLRRGELIPLTWSDVDLDKKTISVNKAVELVKGKPIVKNTAKSEKSIRTVYIPQILVDFLKNEKRTSLLVCTSARGKMMSESAWRRMWESYLTDLNLKYGNFGDSIKLKGKAPKSKFDPAKLDFVIPRITAHWLRHTFITMMYFAGVDILTAKEQAGHSDIKTTMEIYTHLDNKFKKKSVSKLDEYLSKRNLTNRDVEESRINAD